MCSNTELLEMARSMSHSSRLVALIPKIPVYALLARHIAEILLNIKKTMMHLQQRPWCSDRKSRHRGVLRVAQGGCIPNLVEIGPREVSGQTDERTN